MKRFLTLLMFPMLLFIGCSKSDSPLKSVDTDVYLNKVNNTEWVAYKGIKRAQYIEGEKELKTDEFYINKVSFTKINMTISGPTVSSSSYKSEIHNMMEGDNQVYIDAVNAPFDFLQTAFNLGITDMALTIKPKKDDSLTYLIYFKKK